MSGTLNKVFEAGIAVEHNDRGINLAEEGNYEQAISEFNKAIELDPEYAEAYSNRGIAYYYKGETDKAVSDLERHIELLDDPRLVEAAQQLLDEMKQ